MSAQPWVITDELRAMVGVESEPHEVEVERSAIRKYADAIQDPNPLYVDAAFAGRTPHGSVIAPPTFPCTFEGGRLVKVESLIPPALSEILNGGVEYLYERPIRLHEVLTVTRSLSDVLEKNGRLGRMLFLIRQVTYRDQNGALVARQRETGIRYAKPAEDQRPQQAAAAAPTRADDRAVPDPPEITAEDRLQPRYVEDVSVGDELPLLPKRPLLKHLVMYAGASGNFLEYHYDPEHARMLGMPGLILHGNLKVAYLGQIVTDWVGAHGTVLKLSARIQGMDLLGDLCLVHGKVSEVSRDGDRGLVALDVWAEAPAGRRTTVGSALVSLPSRASS